MNSIAMKGGFIWISIKILRTEDDVLKYIKNMDYEKECEKTRIMIKEKLIHLGGHATEMCLVKLFEK